MPIIIKGAIASVPFFTSILSMMRIAISEAKATLISNNQTIIKESKL